MFDRELIDEFPELVDKLAAPGPPPAVHDTSARNGRHAQPERPTSIRSGWNVRRRHDVRLSTDIPRVQDGRLRGIGSVSRVPRAPRARRSSVRVAAEIPRVGRPKVTTVPTFRNLLARRRCHVSASRETNPTTWPESWSQFATFDDNLDRSSFLEHLTIPRQLESWVKAIEVDTNSLGGLSGDFRKRYGDALMTVATHLRQGDYMPDGDMRMQIRSEFDDRAFDED